MPVRVSVALCTYNGAAYLEEQLLSILGQSLPVCEIVVSDDGSTDDTLAVVERVTAGLVGIEVVVLRNATARGVTANFEQALAACSGELIALCDQDDIWWPERVDRMVSEFIRRPSLEMLHADARLVGAAGVPLGFTLLQTLGVSAADRAAVHAGHAIDAYLRRNIVTGATMMLRRELVERSRPFPAAWVHDEWMAMVAASTGLVDLLDEPLTDYRQHGGNQIGVTNLDASGKLGRLRVPRTARNARLLARAAALQQRASAFEPSASASVLAMIDAKLAHEARRSALPAARLLRVGPVVRGWRAGDYSRFGLGLQDMLRDLVQPV
ncbi:glycosyltransferase family 2 protein [Cryobacterium suzukii]|uniref:Glycosyltransferase family 2 protein n=1 Tax=Cryobacterium suzukii TaxID=1259198 RepID=A0A4R9AG31_9MICO|nr:glycosyltransferase family 2 protein [Cryobacterium suzukii]TFD61344.1 glycosyltransferase family 2 protein [Cryobacterium suzukii]